MSSSPDCSKCDALCCKHVAIQIDKPDCKKDYDHIRWYLLHENIEVFIDHENCWFVKFQTPCTKIKNGLCSSYESRPKICRDYPNEENHCEFEGEDDYFVRIFRNEDDFIDYLELKKIRWEFKNRN
ncbi:MAG: YkgJ family cysteine cluster protein [Spirochaetes bacterium]|nr:YkgJ family cysteine cluster protein [Spirochaetota bacterium]